MVSAFISESRSARSILLLNRGIPAAGSRSHHASPGRGIVYRPAKKQQACGISTLRQRARACRWPLPRQFFSEQILDVA